MVVWCWRCSASRIPLFTSQRSNFLGMACCDFALICRRVIGFYVSWHGLLILLFLLVVLPVCLWPLFSRDTQTNREVADDSLIGGAGSVALVKTQIITSPVVSHVEKGDYIAFGYYAGDSPVPGLPLKEARDEEEGLVFYRQVGIKPNVGFEGQKDISALFGGRFKIRGHYTFKSKRLFSLTVYCRLNEIYYLDLMAKVDSFCKLIGEKRSVEFGERERRGRLLEEVIFPSRFGREHDLVDYVFFEGRWAETPEVYIQVGGHWVVEIGFNRQYVPILGQYVPISRAQRPSKIKESAVLIQYTHKSGLVQALQEVKEITNLISDGF